MTAANSSSSAASTASAHTPTATTTATPPTPPPASCATRSASRASSSRLHRRRRGERPLRRRHIPPRGMGPRPALLKAERLVRAVRLREKNQRPARPRRRRRRLPPLVPGLQDFLGTKGKRTPPRHAASLSMSPQNAPVWGSRRNREHLMSPRKFSVRGLRQRTVRQAEAHETA